MNSIKKQSNTLQQQTLKAPISCTGVALHSGDKVSMTLCPAAADSGIVFKRTDIQGGGAVIPARFDNVVDTRMCTVLGNADGVTVSTVEHLMAAFAGAGIDNAIVEINAAEVPVMDGSSAPFLFLMDCAGTVKQNAPRRAIRVLKEITVEDGDRVVSLVPADGFTLNFEIDFESAAIQRQTLSFEMADGAFKDEIARARTFGFLHEVEHLRSLGLAKGGSLANAVVISGDEILNEDGLRFDDEFVRHKILDAVGDLFLAGGALLGAFDASRSGHDANNRLLRALFADPANYEIVDAQPAIASVGGWRKESIAAAAAE